MPRQSKDYLIRTFERVSSVEREDIRDVVQSTFIRGEGLDHSGSSGLEITANGAANTLLTFYEDNGDNKEPWKIQLDGNKGLNFDVDGSSKLYIDKSGRIGISNTKPNYALDVNGYVGMQGRVGTYKKGKKPADGNWHTILSFNENDCCGVELIAYIADNTHERFGLTYIIALYPGGRDGGNITMVNEASNRFWFFGRKQNKIRFRWDKTDNGCDLQMKSHSHYGNNNHKKKQIFFRASKVWDKSFEDGIMTPNAIRSNNTVNHNRPVITPSSKNNNSGQKKPIIKPRPRKK